MIKIGKKHFCSNILFCNTFKLTKEFTETIKLFKKITPYIIYYANNKIS